MEEFDYQNIIPETPFIAFTSDYGFKATFGNESDTLFLRRALQALIKSSTPIKSISFIKTDFQGITIDSRSGVYDLACIDDNNNHFIVEMQVSEYPQFIQRMKFYAFHKFNTMVKKGKFLFSELPPIYCVGILAKNIYPYDEYYCFGQLANQKGNIMDDKLTYVTVELEKFNLSVSEITTDLEKLIFTMKNLQTYSNTPTTQFPSFWNEDWLNLAIKELDTRHFTPEQLEQYMMMIAHNASAVENERLNILKARQEEKDNMVIKLHKKGLSNEEISNLLDFPAADIKRIISNIANK